MVDKIIGLGIVMFILVRIGYLIMRLNDFEQDQLL